MGTSSLRTFSRKHKYPWISSSSFYFSLVISTDGTGIVISASVMNTVTGLLLSLRMLTALFPLLINQDSSAASLTRTGKGTIESQLGQGLHGKTCRIYFTRQFSGTHLSHTNGKVRDHLLLRVSESMKLMLAW